MKSQFEFNSQSNSGSITTQLPTFCATLHSIHLRGIYPGDRLRYSLAEHWCSSCLGWIVCLFRRHFSIPIAISIPIVFGFVCLNAARRLPPFQDLGGRQANSCCRHKSQSEAAWAVEAMPLQLNYRSTISWRAPTSYTQWKKVVKPTKITEILITIIYFLNTDHLRNL